MNGGLLSDFGRDLSDSRTPRSHAPVVHAVEVALLAELVPGALGLGGHLLLPRHLRLHVAQLVACARSGERARG